MKKIGLGDQFDNWSMTHFMISEAGWNGGAVDMCSLSSSDSLYAIIPSLQKKFNKDPYSVNFKSIKVEEPNFLVSIFLWFVHVNVFVDTCIFLDDVILL